MTKTCKSILLGLGLLLTTNGWSFIFKIDHYINQFGQHIFIFSDKHTNNEAPEIKEPSNNQQRYDIVNAAAKIGAVVIAEDLFVMFNPLTRKRLLINPQFDEPERMYLDLLKNPTSFNKNSDYSKDFSKTFFTKTCPNFLPPIMYLSQLCRKKNVLVENIDCRILSYSSMDEAPINASDAFYEIEQAYEAFVKFSKENNPFADYIKKLLITYNIIRKNSWGLRNQLIKINKPLYQTTIRTLDYTSELDQLFSLTSRYTMLFAADQEHLSEKQVQEIINNDIKSTNNEGKISSILNNHDFSLVDMNILHSIFRHLNSKVIFVCAGFLHTFYTEKALEQLDYKKIDTFGFDYELNNPMAVKPIDIAQYFAKNETLSKLNTEKEKKETPMQDICAVCGRTDAKYRCGNCKQIDYCSSDCQRKDWTNHKNICKKK